MTSKLTRERIELIANFHRAMTLPPSHDEIEELARMALAAMDSEPVGTLSVRAMSYSGKKIGTQFGFVHSDAAMKVPEGDFPLYRHAQPATVVPEEMTPEMMRAVQLNSELGAYAASNLSGAYDLFAEFWKVACRAAMINGGKL